MAVVLPVRALLVVCALSSLGIVITQLWFYNRGDLHVELTVGVSPDAIVSRASEANKTGFDSSERYRGHPEDTPMTVLALSERHRQGPSTPQDAITTRTGNASSEQDRLSMNMVIVPYFHYPNATKESLAMRREEYRTVLQRNLNHKLVSHIHILATPADNMSALYGDLLTHKKAVLSEVRSIDKMRDPFEYISQNLVGKDVMFANADIYLGRGFERVDPHVMSSQRIMYALTRRFTPEELCKRADKQDKFYTTVDLCTESTYRNSHDLFLFRLSEPMPEELLKLLDYKLGKPGMENALMWVFKTKWNYCLLNPCGILEGFHLHCSKVRNIPDYHVGRVDVEGQSGRAHFTTNLRC